MKFTVIFATILSTSWALKVKLDVSKGKREAPSRYQSSKNYVFGTGGVGESGQSVGSPYAQAYHGYGDDASSAVSIGAGYSIGGPKSGFGYELGEEGQGLSSAEVPNQGSVQLPTITLQGEQGGFVSNDLSQLMSQLSHGLNSGQLQLGSYQSEGHTGNNNQALAVPQYALEEPKLQQYVLSQPQGLQNVPSYAAGTKGLGSFGTTGPVLFSQPSNGNPFSAAYGFTNGGQSIEAGASSAERLPSGSSLENIGQSLSGPAHGLFGHGVSYGLYSGSKGSISLPSKTFKPSAYVGSTGESGHGLGGPSFASSSLPGSRGVSIGSAGHVFGFSKIGLGGAGGAKYYSPVYGAAKKRFNSLDSFSSGSHSSGSHSPPRTTYGVPTDTYTSVAPSSMSPSAISSQYHIKYTGFGDGNSFKGVIPVRSHTYSGGSNGHKYNFGSQSIGSFGPVKDIEGSYSENSYNTIKYSEELKSHVI